MINFTQRLNELMGDSNIKEKDLAKLLSYETLSTIYTWTSGVYIPKIDIIFKLSNIFKCSIEYLIGRTNDLTTFEPKEQKPFHIVLTNLLESKNLKITYLRNNKIISSGLHQSIFYRHATPIIETVVKIADYFQISVDELVGRV